MYLLVKKMRPSDLFKFRQIFHSVFTKLFLIGFVAWFLILASVITSFIVNKHNPRGPFYRNARLYVQYILADLGSPPSREKALTLHNTAGIDISFSNGEETWTTSEHFPPVDRIRFRRIYTNEEIQIGRESGHHYVKVENSNGLFLFELDKAYEDEQNEHVHILLIGILSVIIVGCYFVIRRVLRPLKWLSKGVTEVKLGNLDHIVPTRGKDELSELATSFNEMTTRLKQIIKSKEHLLRDISHELRSPLTRIKIAAQLIIEEDIRKDIEEDIDEMEAMIATILDSSRDYQNTQKLQHEVCEIRELISQVAKKYEKIAPGIILHPCDQKIYCEVHAPSLKTVFSNCIDNGLKFSTDQDHPVEIRLAIENDCCLVTITDFGIGMEKEELGVIFEPFYRIDSSRSRKTGGFGLGLSICKAVIEAHNGTISASSSQKEGTTITITLPLQPLK